MFFTFCDRQITNPFKKAKSSSSENVVSCGRRVVVVICWKLSSKSLKDAVVEKAGCRDSSNRMGSSVVVVVVVVVLVVVVVGFLVGAFVWMGRWVVVVGPCKSRC